MRFRSLSRLLGGLLLLAALAACGGFKDATLGGSVSGLGSGLSLVLQNTGNGDTLTLTSNGSFTFAKDLAASTAYDVVVLTQPVGQSCTVSGGSGSINSYDASVSSIAVSCVLSSSVGGTVSGLGAGAAVTLALNNGQTLALAANGSFSFPGTLTAGSNYTVTVSQQPSGQKCTVSNGSGTVVSGSMATVTVSCS